MSTPRGAWLGFILFTALLAGCGQGGNGAGDAAKKPQVPASPLSGGIEPATYVGDLPCADCPGIRYTLNLYPDQSFILRTVYIGKMNASGVDEVGRWSRPGNADRLVLRDGQDTTMVLAIKSDAILRKLDTRGHEIESEHNYDLTRAEAFQPIEPQGMFSGMYEYMADAGVLEECRTGLRLPVAAEGDNAALESAYGESGTPAGTPVLVTVEGRIARRPGPDGAEPVSTLIVERFLAVRPGEVCGMPFLNEDLRGTRWMLARLGDRDVPAPPGGKDHPSPRPADAPWFRLALNDLTMTGFTGCNTLGGNYALDGDKLRFADIVLTKKACPGADSYEPDFPRALETASHWKVTGRHLELFDDLGTMLARFRSDAE